MKFIFLSSFEIFEHDLMTYEKLLKVKWFSLMASGIILALNANRCLQKVFASKNYNWQLEVFKATILKPKTFHEAVI